MAISFDQLGYRWTVRDGFPPMGSTEASDPDFVSAIRGSHPRLARLTDHELASWIVARLNYLTSGALCVSEETYSHDTNEFGYKLKITDHNKKSLAHGAVVIHAERTYFASVNVAVDDFLAIVVELLTEYPDDLNACSVRVQEPETRKYRQYGWDGYSLYN